MRQFRIWFLLLYLVLFIFVTNSFADVEKHIPSLEIVLKEVRSSFSEKESSKHLEGILFETKRKIQGRMLC